MEMDDRPAAAGWAELEDAYGEASEVPQLLYALRWGTDPQGSAEDLADRLVHQGFMVYSAAVAAAPLLVDLALDPDTPDRAAVLRLLGGLARAAAAAAPDLSDKAAWLRMWPAQLPRLAGIMADEDVGVRRMAPAVLTTATADRGRYVDRLLRAAESEPDEPALLGELVAAAELLPGVPASERDAAAARVSALASGRSPQVGMAVAFVLRQARPVAAAALLAALRAPDTDLWAATWCIYGRTQRRVLIGWAEQRLGTDRDTRRALGRGLLGADDAMTRCAGLGVLMRLAASWRSDTSVLRTEALAALEDADATVRRQAMFALAVSRAPEPSARDRIAALADRPDGGPGPMVAVWALARAGDPRCVPHLLGALNRADLGYPHHQVYEMAVSQVTLPSVDEILLEASAWADRLLPDVIQRLRSAGAGRARQALLRTVIGWGPAARPALPVLLECLRQPEPALCIVALAAIGARPDEVPAESLRPACERASAEPGTDQVALVRAFAQLSGRLDPVLAALPDVASGERWPAPALHLAGALGPAGLRYAERLEQYMSAPGTWSSIGAALSHRDVGGRPEVSGRALTRFIGDLPAGRPAEPADLTVLARLEQMGYADPELAGVLRYLAETDARATGPARDWHGIDLDEALAATAARMLARSATPCRPSIRPPAGP